MRQHDPSDSTKRPIAEALRSMLLAGSIASLAIVAAPAALAQDPAAATAETAAGAVAPAEAAETAAPARKQIHVAISESDPDVRSFNDHVTVLSSPWMEGRLPGTRGMERAMEYMEYWFKQAGLEPAFQPSDGGPKSYRQPFPLGGRREVVEQKIALVGDAAPLEFSADTDFKLSALGRDGTAEGAIAFVGYGIEDGPDGYNSFAEDHSLEGKIALLLRFEPMNADGNSLWSGGDGWSGRAGFAGKISAVAKRKPAAIIVVNTPGANDPRIASLSSGGGRAMAEVPVFMMSTDAASRLVETATGGARTLMALRQHADAPPADAPRSFDIEGARLSIAARMEEKKIQAENVVGVLPGRGELAKEVIVIGGHLDHLGYGDFGSREGAAGSGKLHPGADDNASGSAGVILLGDMLKELYEQVPAEQPLRTILFIGFSAEESGLNGSRYYVDNPIYPIKDTVLMMNFDMIGRILNGRLSVSGAGGAKGMQEWADPFFANSGLTVIQSDRRGGGGSDHASFQQAGVPILFAIIADFHEDYHTSRDVLDLIDREASVLAVRLWRDLAFDMAKRPQRFETDSSSGPMRPQPARVRAGLRTRESEDGEGIEVETVTEGGSAAKAGIQTGDRIVKWNKKEMKSRQDFVDDLRTHEPGAVVQAVVIRNGEELTIYVTLQGPREQQ